MISWRYHVVSIVAVVLAFGLGILAGTAVVNDEFVRELQENYDRAQEERDAARAEVARLERFAAALLPTLRDDQLLGRDAVVVTIEGLDRPAQLALEELGDAGADVLAALRLTGRALEPSAPDDVDALQVALGTSSTDPVQLTESLAEALGVRLAVGPDGVEAEDLLAALLAEGFVTADRDLDQADLRAIGGASQSIVVAAGGLRRDDLPAPGAFVLPFTERLVQLGASVAVAGVTDDAYGTVATVRDDPEVPDCSVVTVDDLDLTIGGIALVMGLERLLIDPDPGFRPGGDYGVEADALVPGGEPPASCRE